MKINYFYLGLTIFFSFGLALVLSNVTTSLLTRWRTKKAFSEIREMIKDEEQFQEIISRLEDEDEF
jgi:hypothetical protein